MAELAQIVREYSNVKESVVTSLRRLYQTWADKTATLSRTRGRDLLGKVEDTMTQTPRHPVIVALVLLCVVRLMVLVAMAVIKGASIPDTALTLLLHLGFTLALGCGLLLLWVVAKLPFLRACITGLALVLLSFSLFLSLSDPILDAIIGERLTPSTLTHFAGPGLFLSDYFWKPVIRYWYAVFPAVTLLAAYIIWMVVSFWTVGRKPNKTPMRWVYPAIGTVVGGAMAVAASSASPSNFYPVEIDYVTQTLGSDGTRLGMSEKEAVERIRNFAILPEGAAWLDEQYPLVYQWDPPRNVPVDKPDIFIFVVESLRGMSLRPVNPDGQQLVSVPAIESMASQGVVFQHFLSNGFPSGPGFVGISSGVWMHPVKRLDGAYSSTSFDRLGSRLRSNGYHTGIIANDVSYDDKTNWVNDVFEDVVDCRAMGLADDDAVTVDMFNEWVGKADATTPQRPLFGIFLTREPHLPYMTKDEGGSWTAGGNLAENYARSIHQVDTELSRAFAFLKSRMRWKNTVVIILGDHANYLDQSVSSGLPVDDTVFTGAIISGGDPAIGPPRATREPASQADISSTVLALGGDWRPSMALGRNLLSDAPARPPRALAIRNGGVRLDMDGQSIMIPKGAVSAAEITPLPQSPNVSPTAVPDPQTIAEAVRIWSWMIENDRVWNQKFLEHP